MIFTTLLALFSAIINVIFSFLPTVTALPFGIDTQLQYFVGFIHGFLTVMPWLQYPFNLFLFGLAVEFSIFTYHFSVTVLRWFRAIG